MKNIIIFFIKIYQIFFSRIVCFVVGAPNVCRFSPTCSEYTVRTIEKYGIIRGGWLSLKRIASCQPFSKRLATSVQRLVKN